MIRVLRRALLLLGVLAGLFAMHGLAPANGTDILAAGPHQHPAVLLAAAGTHGLTATPADRTPADWTLDDLVVAGAGMDDGMAVHATPDLPGLAMPADAMPASSGVASPGLPSPGHGGHGSHVDRLCLAVLAGGVVLLLTLAVLAGLGRPGSRARIGAFLGRLGRPLASALPLRPPELSRLCVLRI